MSRIQRIFNLTTQDIEEGKRLCRDNVKRLLDDAEAIIQNNDGSISSGLYSFAVEELGKYLLLKKMSNASFTGTISANPEIFGPSKSGHTPIKFWKFQHEITIPDECKKINLHIGSVPIIRQVNVNGILMPMNSGVMPVQRETLMNFDYRKTVFYVDWDNTHWTRHEDVVISDLLNAITKLKSWISSNIP